MAVKYSRCRRRDHYGQNHYTWDAETSTLIITCRACDAEQRQEVDFKARYAEYLKTPQWLDLRARKLKRAGFRCQLCNASKSLEVHHRSYANLGHEPLEDLIVLCDPCHELFHRERGLA